MTSFAKIALIGAPLALLAAPASAGQWAVDLGRCPDHLEDIRDRLEDRFDARRVTSARDLREDRRDARESRRDERVTVCPGQALVFNAAAPGRAKPWRRPEKITLYRRHGGFFRVNRHGRLTPVATIAPRAGQIEKLRRAARRDARQEVLTDLSRRSPARSVATAGFWAYGY